MDILEPEWLQAPGKSEINPLRDPMKSGNPRLFAAAKLTDFNRQLFFNLKTVESTRDL